VPRTSRHAAVCPPEAVAVGGGSVIVARSRSGKLKVWAALSPKLNCGERGAAFGEPRSKVSIIPERPLSWSPRQLSVSGRGIAQSTYS
jgi:hypothetical protein